MCTTPLLLTTLVACGWLLLPAASTAQPGNSTVIRQYGGANVVVNQQRTPFVGSIASHLTYDWDSFEETFGSNAQQMNDIATVALRRHPDDRFEWWKKPMEGGFTTNSCAAAASNLFDAVEADGLPPGWKIRQVGTLGSLTTFENALVNDYSDILQWYGTGTFDPAAVEFDALNPKSYAHSLTIVQAPNGQYYTVDTWGDDVEFKEVFPIDPEAKYFSEDPDETDLFNSVYKLSGLDDRGRGWNEPVETAGPPRDPRLRQRSEPPPTSEETRTEALTSADPNDKMGLPGVGDARFVTPDVRMPYVIRFENLATASAPAQEVLVRDTLDTRVLDLSTFQLGDITFGSRYVPVAPGRSQFFARVPLGTDGRLVLLIDAHLVPETGIVTWRFTTIAVATSTLPDDPLDGFLPPNRTSPEGEGSVSFNVRTRAGLPSGTVIRNQARIFFDLNAPIDTPPWVNTLDHEPPTSRVRALPARSDSVFPVTWAGQDAGAGVRQFDVFASVNGGPFYQWLRRVPLTAEPFVGDADSTYSFYSIAYDAAGNVEPGKTAGEATTGVVVATEGDAPAGPAELTLAAPFPNPASGGRPLTLTFGLPEPGPADVRVYDVQGRELATLSNRDHPAGWHSVRWDLQGVASGVYVVRLRTDSGTRTRTVTVAR